MGTERRHSKSAGADWHPPTVRDVLELDAMARADVLGGAKGLDREVTGANIVEVPDVYRWMQGGEVLFTAGYAWRDDPQRMIEVMQELDRVGISALGVKPGRYLHDIPEGLVSVADELKLPLIRIPPDVAYRDVIEPLYRRLTTERLLVLERSTQAQEAFMSLGLDEESMEKVAGALAVELSNPLYVIDLVDDTAVIAGPDGSTERASIEEISGRDGEVVREVAELTLRRTPRHLELEGGSALGASLIVGRRALGRIAVLEREALLDEFAERAFAHGAELLSFLLMRQVAIMEGRREAGDLFFNSLMSDSLTNEEAAERAVTLGLRLTRSCTALVVGVPEQKDEADILRICAERALTSWPHVLGEAVHGGDVLVLLQVPDTVDDVVGHVAEHIESLARRSEIEDVLVASGSARTGLHGVRRSRSEATIAYQVGSRLGRTGLVRFADLRVERLLAQISPSLLSRDYIDMTIGPLTDAPDLLKTLETFLEHGGNKVATAAAIPLHRSSLTYRLDKISDLLGADLRDPEVRLELWLALRLRRVFRLSEGDSAR